MNIGCGSVMLCSTWRNGETSTTDLAGTTGTAHLVQIAGLAMQGFADYGKVSQLSLTNLLICCRTSGQIGFLLQI